MGTVSVAKVSINCCKQRQLITAQNWPLCWVQKMDHTVLPIKVRE